MAFILASRNDYLACELGINILSKYKMYISNISSEKKPDT